MKVDDYIDKYAKLYGDDFKIYQHADYIEITFHNTEGKAVLIGKLLK